MHDGSGCVRMCHAPSGLLKLCDSVFRLCQNCKWHPFDQCTNCETSKLHLTVSFHMQLPKLQRYRHIYSWYQHPSRMIQTQMTTLNTIVNQAQNVSWYDHSEQNAVPPGFCGTFFRFLRPKNYWFCCGFSPNLHFCSENIPWTTFFLHCYNFSDSENHRRAPE